MYVTSLNAEYMTKCTTYVKFECLMHV